MKSIFPVLFFVLLAPRMADAQVDLIPVVEHFSNTKCSVCASHNPGFYVNYNAVSGVGTNPEITYFSIYPSAPYVGCFLSQQNKIQSDARAHYYSVYGSTPRFVVDGAEPSITANIDSSSFFTPYIGLKTPYGLRVETFYKGTDSIHARITIKKYSADTQDASLFLGLVEDTVFGNGGNGETEHYNVLRNSLTIDSGLAVPLAALNVGDSFTVEKTAVTDSFWSVARMKTVAILRNRTNGTILQSGISRSVTVFVSGIAEPSEVEKIKLYPNPAQQSAIVEPMDEHIDYRIQLFSITGDMVLSKQFQGKQRIDVSYLPDGIYFSYITSADFNFAQKLIVAH